MRSRPLLTVAAALALSVVAGCGKPDPPATAANGANRGANAGPALRRGGAETMPGEPQADRRNDPATAAALDAVLREQVTALQALDALLEKFVSGTPAERPPLAQIEQAAERVATAKQTLIPLMPRRPQGLSHTPDATARVVGRYRDRLRQLTSRVAFNFEVAVGLDLPRAERFAALAKELGLRHAPPGGTPPQPGTTPGIPRVQPALEQPAQEKPASSEPGQPPELTAEELWAALEKHETRPIVSQAGGLVRVTGIVSSRAGSTPLSPMTMATAEKGALQLRFARGFDVPHVRPLQKITVTGKLSIVRGIDNLPSIEQIGSLTVETDEQTETPPPLFLVFADTDGLIAECRDQPFYEQHTLIASLQRPVIVSGTVAAVEEFQNEFLKTEKRIRLRASDGGVVCRFASADEAAALRRGEKIRIVGLWRLADPGRPKNEVWLKDCWMYR